MTETLPLPGIPTTDLTASPDARRAADLLVRHHELVRLAPACREEQHATQAEAYSIMSGLNEREVAILQNLDLALPSLDDREDLLAGAPDMDPDVAIAQERWFGGITALRHRGPSPILRARYRAACFEALGFRSAAAAFRDHAALLTQALGTAGRTSPKASKVNEPERDGTVGEAREALDAPVEAWEGRFLALRGAVDALVRSIPDPAVQAKLAATIDGSAALMRPGFERHLVLRSASVAAGLPSASPAWEWAVELPSVDRGLHPAGRLHRLGRPVVEGEGGFAGREADGRVGDQVVDDPHGPAADLGQLGLGRADLGIGARHVVLVQPPARELVELDRRARGQRGQDGVSHEVVHRPERRVAELRVRLTVACEGRHPRAVPGFRRRLFATDARPKLLFRSGPFGGLDFLGFEHAEALQRATGHVTALFAASARRRCGHFAGVRRRLQRRLPPAARRRSTGMTRWERSGATPRAGLVQPFRHAVA